jgi:hypothetical protein
MSQFSDLSVNKKIFLIKIILFKFFLNKKIDLSRLTWGVVQD